jgi:biopolymer transport protein ExbB/biopolymer transport protein TolQ
MELDNFAAHLETVFMTDYLQEKGAAAKRKIRRLPPRRAPAREAEPSSAATGH